MIIRKARKSDLKEILSLFNNSKELAGDKNDSYETYTIKQYIHGPVFKTFVAEVNGEIVGVISIELWKKAKYSYLDNIVVAKKFRGQKIGYLLMCYAEKFIKKQGSKYFFYYTEEGNKAMQKMSDKLNYKKGKKFIFYSKYIK
ncbi:GNAT family N-acetyltransferase [Candidatus Pacearchaeota archaeon]|nr:GNAT family N-acetyltransferase [Candidatus Pacearchaeota archaeon]